MPAKVEALIVLSSVARSFMIAMAQRLMAPPVRKENRAFAESFLSEAPVRIPMTEMNTEVPSLEKIFMVLWMSSRSSRHPSGSVR